MRVTPKRPHFRLVIGTKPHNTVDLDLVEGRVTLEVSRAPDCPVKLEDILDARWGKLLANMTRVWESVETLKVAGSLEEPAVPTLKAELARLAKAGVSA